MPASASSFQLQTTFETERRRRPERPSRLRTRSYEAGRMKVLIADKFEQSGIDGRSAACDVATSRLEGTR